MTDPLTLGIYAIAGLAALCFGRRLFWLFVGAAGFVAAFQLVSSLLPGRQSWLLLCIALGGGIAGALLAVGLQYVAAALAGFVAGAYATIPLAQAFGASPWIILLAGVLGALLMLLVFDWALIVLSALLGARALVVVSGLVGPLAALAWLLLTGLGVGIQASMLSPSSHPLANRPPRERS